jgi:hypothetical protein
MSKENTMIRKFSLVVFVVALALTLLALSAHATEGAQSTAAATQFTATSAAAYQSRSVEQLLKPGGTLNVNTGWSGTLDLRGWDVTPDAGRVPLFQPAKPSAGGWLALGTGVGDMVRAIAVGGNMVYAGGDFTRAGSCTSAGGCSFIARWDTSTQTWSALSTGMQWTVYAIAISGNDVYVGGKFTRAGTCSSANGCNAIAKWNTSTNTWSPLGTGLKAVGTYGIVHAIAVSGNDVYVGGLFTDAGGVAANNIAKWDGSAWSTLGTGTAGGVVPAVYALAVSGNDVYAGGEFTSAGTCSSADGCNYIARWNTLTNTWSALGGGTNAWLDALAISGSDIYVGGAFSSAGTCTKADGCYSVAKWNTSTNTWSPLLPGTTEPMVVPVVNALAVSGNDVYVGGNFDSRGGVAAKNVAKWDGSTWSALGSGTNGYVAALAASDSDVYAGGWFTSAGGMANTYYIAKYNAPVVGYGVIAGGVYSNSVAPANVLSGAYVQACAGSICGAASTDASGQYTVTGLPDGSYRATAFPPAGPTTLLPAAIGPITLSVGATLSGQDIVLKHATQFPPDTTISPSTPCSGNPDAVCGQCWAHNCAVITGPEEGVMGAVAGCAGGTASYEITQDANVIRSGSMLEGPSGIYSATLAPFYPLYGNMHARITLVCPAETIVREGDFYIIPGGSVKTTTGSPIVSATVTLFRSDTAGGTFSQVPNGSGLMSPSNRNNPDTTDSAGQFGWDVMAGFYKVRAAKAGCFSPINPGQAFVETAVMQLPPPAANLELVLSCNKVYLPVVIK